MRRTIDIYAIKWMTPEPTWRGVGAVNDYLTDRFSEQFLFLTKIKQNDFLLEEWNVLFVITLLVVFVFVLDRKH